MEGIELICFQMISCVGAARSSYIEGIQEAKKGNIQAARKKIAEGEKTFTEGHHAHAKLIQEEASGNKTDFSLILMHAEDQLMSAESFGILSKEFIDLYEIVTEK